MSRGAQIWTASKTCPHCGQGIDIRGYWSNVPKTRWGEASGLLTSGRPGFLCPNCGKEVVIADGWLSLFVWVLWPTLIIAASSLVGVHRPLSSEAKIAIGAVLITACVVQWVVAPCMLRLRRPEVGEKLNIVGGNG